MSRPELAPFYSRTAGAPTAASTGRRDVFEDGSYHDSIRGTCPEGHDRMLED